MNKHTVNVILPTAVIKVPNKLARVILDSCSQTNLVTESLVKRLGLPVFDSSSIISCIAKNSIPSKFSCSLTIRSRFSNDVIKIFADVVPYIPYVSKIDDLLTIQQRFQLKKPGEVPFLDGKVELLIGAEHYEHCHCMLDDRHFFDDLAIRDTIFGEVVIGRYQNTINLKIPSSTQCLLTIDEQLRKFWELEEIDVPNSVDEEEAACSAHFEANYSRDDDGRFIPKTTTM